MDVLGAIPKRMKLYSFPKELEVFYKANVSCKEKTS